MNATTVDAVTAGAATRMPAYPLSILIGCAALDEVPAFDALPDGFWRVVARLVKKISVATPFQAIFARRDTLARESGKSVETVGRALRWLEDEGFITRQQKSRRGLRGSDAHIHPTEKLIDALGIVQQRRTIATPKPPQITAPDPDLSTEPAVKNDGSVSALQVHSLLTKKQSAETFRKTIIIEGKVIPADLGWMAKDRGLPATAILCLMKLARRAKQRLSDVVACCNDALRALRGNALFAYLRKLIAQDKDYSYIVRKGAETEMKEHQERQDAALVERKTLEWQGQKFVSRDQQRIWTVEASGAIVLHQDGRQAARRMDKGFVEAVMNGDLRRLAA